MKFSSSFAETFRDWNLNEILPRSSKPAGRAEPFLSDRRAAFSNEIHRTQAERFHLAQRIGPARGVKHALGNFAVGLQRSVGKRGHV